jgi:hypothetical protein
MRSTPVKSLTHPLMTVDGSLARAIPTAAIPTTGITAIAAKALGLLMWK